MFVSFSKTLVPFEAQLKRKCGLEEDGIVDGIFDFSKPISSDYYWCPPLGYLEFQE